MATGYCNTLKVEHSFLRNVAWLCRLKSNLCVYYFKNIVFSVPWEDNCYYCISSVGERKDLQLLTSGLSKWQTVYVILGSVTPDFMLLIIQLLNWRFKIQHSCYGYLHLLFPDAHYADKIMKSRIHWKCAMEKLASFSYISTATAASHLRSF